MTAHQHSALFSLIAHTDIDECLVGLLMSEKREWLVLQLSVSATVFGNFRSGAGARAGRKIVKANNPEEL